jgi:hypothetical protein
MQKHLNHIEKLRKITFYSILSIVFLLTALYLLLQTSYIQTKITQFVTKEISQKLNSEISISNVKLSLFKGFIFDKIFIEDQHKDTLLVAKQVSLIPQGLQLNFSDIALKEIQLNEVYFNLYEVSKDTLNIQFLLDAFSSENEKDTEGSFQLTSQKFNIENSSFSYRLLDTAEVNGINFKDLSIDSLSIDITNLLISESIQANINSISFNEKSGFQIKKLSTNNLVFNPEEMRLSGLKISTGNSHFNFDSLGMNYPKGYVFEDFIHDVGVYIDLNSALVSYNDVKYFTGDTLVYNEMLGLSAKITGSANDFSIKKLYLNYEDLLNLDLTAEIKELPDFENPEFDIRIRNLSTNIEKLRSMTIPGKDEFLAGLPEELDAIKNLNFKGTSKGKMSQFVSAGKLSGNFGTIDLNAITRNDSVSGLNVEGIIMGEELDLAETFENKDLGKLSFNQEVNFSYLKSKKIKLNTIGSIDEFIYKNFSYSNVELYAELFDKKVDSLSVRINQEDVKATLSGNIDFIPTVPEFNIVADVIHADLRKMNLDSAQYRSTASLQIEAFFNGLNIDDFTGFINLTRPLNYVKDSIEVNMNKFVLNGYSVNVNEEESKKIILDSDIIDGQIISKGKASSSFAALKNLLLNLFIAEGNRSELDIDTTETGFIDFEANIKDPTQLTDLFFPQVKLSDNTSLYGYYHPNKSNLNLSVNSQELIYNEIILSDFYVIAYTKDQKIYAGIGGSKLQPNESFFVENFNLEGDVNNDSVNFNLIWNNFKDSAAYAADISGYLNFRKKEARTVYECSFFDSKLIMNDVSWQFSKSKIRIDSSLISISDLSFRNDDEHVYLDGNISKYPGDILYAEFKNFKLSNLAPLTPPDLDISGRLNGSATLAQLYDAPLIFTKDSIADFRVNEMDFGNFYISSNWDNLGNKIHLNAYNLKGSNNQFMNDTIYGDYWPDKDSIDFTIDIRSLTLRTLEEYYAEYLVFNRSAYISGLVNLNGSVKNPSYSGNLILKQAAAKVNFLNTVNTFDETSIYFNNSVIEINETKLISGNTSNTALLKGNIKHNNFTDFVFDISFKPNNYMLSDIRYSDTAYFYGRAYGSGELNVRGPLKDLRIDADISTNKHTNITIQISSAETFEEETAFMRFVGDSIFEDTVEIREEIYKADISGVDMGIKLNVTNDAVINIGLGEPLGLISSYGLGTIDLKMNKEGDLSMFGNYIIDGGQLDFDLGLAGLTKRKFLIEEDGRLTWYGPPDEATLSITAVNKLTGIALKNLNYNPNETETQKTDAKCIIEMSGLLIDPDYKFDVEIEEQYQEYAQLFNNMNQNDINQQFLYLLILRQFKKINSTGDSPMVDFNAMGEELTTEFLNSMIKSVIPIDVGLKYESGEGDINDQVGVEVSQSIWDDRIEITGGFGSSVGNAESNKPTDNYVGEFEIEAKLTPKGNIRAKVYNEANNRYDNVGQYTQGAGFIWRMKLNSFKFWAREEEKDSIRIKRFIKKLEKKQNTEEQ